MPLQRNGWGAASLLSDPPRPTVVSAVTIIPRVARPIASPWVRPTVRGKFLWVGEEKFYIRGVTYGTFRPGADGSAFPVPRIVEQDFAQMSANGVNAVRTYTAPPRWLLDLAEFWATLLPMRFPRALCVGTGPVR